MFASFLWTPFTLHCLSYRTHSSEGVGSAQALKDTRGSAGCTNLFTLIRPRNASYEETLQVMTASFDASGNLSLTLASEQASRHSVQSAAWMDGESFNLCTICFDSFRRKKKGRRKRVCSANRFISRLSAPLHLLCATYSIAFVQEDLH